MPGASAVRQVPARVESVSALVEWAGAAAREAGLSDEKANGFEVALEEALVNVCRYAYAPTGNGAGEVELALETGDSLVVAVITDEGTPFDPLARPAPDLEASIEERPIGGLGIHLMKSLADEVRYFRDGGRNVLTLRVGPPAAAQAG